MICVSCGKETGLAVNEAIGLACFDCSFGKWKEQFQGWLMEEEISGRDLR